MNNKNSLQNENIKWWNTAVESHADSTHFNTQKFKQDKNAIHLGSTEIEEVGSVKGKTLLYLQCHMGIGAMSWQRLGAQVTGIDFSSKAIEKAKCINAEANLDTKFICADIYDLENVVNEKFDIVFSSYGSIEWIRDLNLYAKIINNITKEGGIFYLIDFHPFYKLVDDEEKYICSSYFQDSPIKKNSGTYAKEEKDFLMDQYVFQHTLSKIINAQTSNGFRIEFFNEFPYSTFKFHWALQEKNGRFSFTSNKKIPLIFSLKSQKYSKNEN